MIRNDFGVRFGPVHDFGYVFVHMDAGSEMADVTIKRVLRRLG